MLSVRSPVEPQQEGPERDVETLLSLGGYQSESYVLQWKGELELVVNLFHLASYSGLM